MMYVYIHTYTHTYIYIYSYKIYPLSDKPKSANFVSKMFSDPFHPRRIPLPIFLAAELASTAAGGGIGGASCVNFCYLQENHQSHGRIIELTYFWWATKVPSDGAVMCCTNLCLVWGATDLILVGGAPVNTAVESNSSSKAPPGIRRKNGPRRVMDDSFSDLKHTCTLS